MTFNEILIPQDSFTETNVTHKRSIVRNFQSFSKIQLFIFNTFCFYTIFFKHGKINIINEITKWCIKSKNLNEIIDTRFRLKLISG